MITIPSCPVCNATRTKAFDATILKRYRVEYFYCDGCGLLQTEPAHWLPEAYANAITALDIDLVARNQANARKLACCLYLLFGARGRHLDFAGGYGLLTRMLRDFGFDAYWFDPYCENLFARGFEDVTGSSGYETASAFEVLEHVQDPLAMLRDIKARSGAHTMFLSTELFEGAPPSPDKWDYYVKDTGQHITFYQARTLRVIAKELGLALHTDGVLHVMTSRSLNAAVLSLASGRLSHLLQLVVRARMRSRTREDQDRATRQLRDDERGGLAPEPSPRAVREIPK